MKDQTNKIKTARWRRSFSLLIIAVLLGAFLCVSAFAEERGEGMAVIVGMGETWVKADYADVYFAVETHSKSSNEAVKCNENITNKVKECVGEQGAWQETGWSLCHDHSGYTAVRQVKCRLRMPDDVPSFLDSLRGAGVTAIHRVDYGASDLSAARADALQTAVEDACRKAEQMDPSLVLAGYREDFAGIPMPLFHGRAGVDASDVRVLCVVQAMFCKK